MLRLRVSQPFGLWGGDSQCLGRCIYMAASSSLVLGDLPKFFKNKNGYLKKRKIMNHW